MPTSAESTQSTKLADVNWLISEEGRGVLSQLAAETTPLTLAKLEQIRKQHGADRTSLIFTQLELRPKAKAKFSQAAEMYFTKIGYQQATGELIANYKAQKFQEANIQTALPVVDGCCGIGGDTMALSKFFQVTAVDLNQQHLMFAKTNCQQITNKEIQTLSQPIEDLKFDSFAAWHLDPDRRFGKQRSIKLENHSPNLAAIESMLKQNLHGCIKLAPAAEIPESWQHLAEAEWISHDRECKQLVLWFGNLAKQPGQKIATKIDQQGRAVCYSPSNTDESSNEASRNFGRYLYEPDPAILAANLVDQIATDFDLSRFTGRSVYLTADHQVDFALLQTLKIIDVLPLDNKQVRARLTKLEVGQVEIKKRGVDILPEQFRKKLKLNSELPNQAVVVLTPTASGNRAIVCEWI